MCFGGAALLGNKAAFFVRTFSGLFYIIKINYTTTQTSWGIVEHFLPKILCAFYIFFSKSYVVSSIK